MGTTQECKGWYVIKQRTQKKPTEEEILQSWSSIRTMIWLHHRDFNEAHCEKATWELHMNAKVDMPLNKEPKRNQPKLDGNYSRMLRAVLNKYWKQRPSKAAAYPTSQKTSTQDKQNVKQGKTHKRCSPVDSHAWAHQCWPTSECFFFQKLSVATRCRLQELPRAMNDKEENQGKPCNQYAWIMMMMIMMMKFLLA